MLAVAALLVSACGRSPRSDGGRIGDDGTVELTDDQRASSVIQAEGNAQERAGGLATKATGRTATSFPPPTSPPTTASSSGSSRTSKSAASPTTAPPRRAAAPAPFDGFRLDVGSELSVGVRRIRVKACNDHSLPRQQRVNWQNPAQGLYIVNAGSGSPVVQYVNTVWAAVEGSLTLAAGECRDLIVLDWDQTLALGCFDPANGTDCLGAATVGPGEYKVKFVWPARETDSGGAEVMYPNVAGVYSAPFTL